MSNCKQNWSISITKENEEVYKKTLIALGYGWYSSQKVAKSASCGCTTIRSASRHEGGSPFFSMYIEATHFNNLEDFLLWHFTEEVEEKTGAQLKIEQLEETINKAQKELQELKEMK